MRKISVVLTAAALMVVMATVAFAAPDITGMVYLSNETVFEDPDTTTTFSGFARVNFSGSVSDNVSYYARVQGNWNAQPTVPLAYVDVKNLLGNGSTLRFGRQSVGWYIENNFAGLSRGTENAVSVTVPAADNVTLRGFVELKEEPKLGARATFAVPAATIGLNVRSQVEGEGSSKERKTGYSVDADVKFSGVQLYGEIGKWAVRPKDYTSDDIRIVGASFDAITNAIGWDNFIEYDIAEKNWAVGLSKTHANKLTTAFTLEGGDGDDLTLTTEVYVSF